MVGHVLMMKANANGCNLCLYQRGFNRHISMQNLGSVLSLILLCFIFPLKCFSTYIDRCHNPSPTLHLALCFQSKLWTSYHLATLHFISSMAFFLVGTSLQLYMPSICSIKSLLEFHFHSWNPPKMPVLFCIVLCCCVLLYFIRYTAYLFCLS